MDEEGFLINGNYYKGGVIAFNDLVLLWDVDSLDKLTTESLKAIPLYNPAISRLVYWEYNQLDMLFIGTGKYTAPIPQPIVDYIHQNGNYVE